MSGAHTQRAHGARSAKTRRVPGLRNLSLRNLSLRNRLSHLDQRHFRHRAARRRRAAITAWSWRLVAAVCTWPALRPRADRDLLRLRRDRPFRKLKAELLLSRFLLDQHDADMAARLELAEQNLVGE